jgi:superfamily II helicase
LEQIKGGNLSIFGMMNGNNDTNSQKQNYERLKWLHSILMEKNTHSNNLEFLNESTSFLETISRLYNPHQSDINVNHEIINALEIEIDDLSNETQNLQKQIQRFTACQRCNSNFEKAGHERRVLRSGQVVCADCATRPPLYPDPFNTNPKKRSNQSLFLYSSQNTKKPKLMSDYWSSSEPLFI